MTPDTAEAAVLAVSLFNAIVLAWLGLTALLNAEKQNSGLWLSAGALLAGGAFFLMQAFIAGHGELNMAMYLQWPGGWLIGLAVVFAWYASMLWYSGYWESRDNALRRRQRIWFAATGALALVVLVLAYLATPYPWSTWANGQAAPGAHAAYEGLLLLVGAYPLFIALCAGLALDALRRPVPSQETMRDTARRRALPWLRATTIGFLGVCALVGFIMMAIGLRPVRTHILAFASMQSGGMIWADLIVSCVLGLSVLLLGQAIVSYEIFTGKALPRRGLRRHWYSAIILAVGYAAVTTWSSVGLASPFFGLILSTVLVTVFYALFSWRSYAERDRYIESLRPFVASSRVYDALLDPAAPEADTAAPFRALAGDLLEADVAYLVPVGPLSSLAGPPLAYPAGAEPPGDLAPVLAQCATPETVTIALDPARYASALWAIPLWSERGLIGLLLLGEKAEGGVYTQEEMEIARSSGERLIDTLAAARMARRLITLQRQRLSETQVVDRRTRRVLHDEALPRLHAAMLTLSAQSGANPGALRELADVHHLVSDLLHEMPSTASFDATEVGVAAALRRAVEDEYATAFEEVTWEVETEAEDRARNLPALTKEVLFYAAREVVRNAARHGRGKDERRALRLRIGLKWQAGLEVTVADDGVGLEAAKRGAATGHGMELHSTMMTVIGGSWVADSVPGAGTRVTLSLPEHVWPRGEK